MHKFKKIGVLLLVVLMVTMLVQEVSFATGKNKLPQAPTEGAPSKNPKHGEGSINQVKIQANQYLMDGQSFIDATNSTVTVSGHTKAMSSVDTIAVDLYLQRWDSSKGQWVDVIRVGEFLDYNTSVVTGGKDVNVVSGYYYRTRAHHWVNEGGTVEQDYSYSTYIYVN